MSPFRLLALGVGDAFSARYYSSCLAVEAAGQRLLIDCPHPIRKVLRESSASAGLTLDLPDFAGIVLTHLHGDHASGLESAGYYGRFILNRRTPLVTHPAVAADVWEHHLAGSMEWSLQ
jgi:glyoxylase-like metal-dependent hydrolase (beta-lactamase superfamily II)